mmetsp:Transcript_17244/g.46686  ORF Transcript_17244/g.46686 Transcript_17244/m.46686 type:complete len:89 (-) Transcript_17244:1398-1664(-)
MVSTLYFAVKGFQHVQPHDTDSSYTHPPGKLNPSPGTNSVASGFKLFPCAPLAEAVIVGQDCMDGRNGKGAKSLVSCSKTTVKSSSIG